MTLKPTDLRKTPFEASTMMDLSSFKLNASRTDSLLKTHQEFLRNFPSQIFSKDLNFLIEDSKDRIIFQEMLAFLQFIHKNDKENSLGNVYFNSKMSLELKELFSCASKVEIPFLTYLFAFKFEFLHINWLHIFEKLLDLMKLINEYSLENMLKNDEISEILHIMIIPLNIFSKEKMKNSYCFCIGINEISNDLIYFLEEFRNQQFTRLNIAVSLKPMLNLMNFPIILQNYLQFSRGILLKNYTNSQYKQIKSLMLTEIEALLSENSSQIPIKLIELKLKLEKNENCRVFLVDISEIDDIFFEMFANRKKIFVSILEHIGEILMQNIANLSFACHAIKGLLIICFQWNDTNEKKEIQKGENLVFTNKFKIIIQGFYHIFDRKFEASNVFFEEKKQNRNIEKNNEEIVEKPVILRKNSMKNSLENLMFFNVKNADFYNEKNEKNAHFSHERISLFRDEEWVQLIYSFCKKMGIILPSKNLAFICSFELLSRIEKIKFLQNEIFEILAIPYYSGLFGITFEQNRICEEYELFFYKIFKFLLSEKEKLVQFLLIFHDKNIGNLLIEIICNEFYNEISSDFFDFSSFTRIFFRKNVNSLVNCYISNEKLIKENHTLILFSFFSNSSFFSDFIEFLVKILMNSIIEKELDEFLLKKTPIFGFLKLCCIVAFDCDNLQHMNFPLKSFILSIKNMIFDAFTEENGKNRDKFITDFFIYSWFYVGFNNKIDKNHEENQDFTKKTKLKKCIERILFEECPWSVEFSIFPLNFFEFLKEDLAFLNNSNEKSNEKPLKKSEFVNGNRLLLKSQSLLVFIYAFKQLKEVKNGDLSEEMIKLKEFLWTYPKIRQIEEFLSENPPKTVFSLNFDKFTDENNLFPLNFAKESRENAIKTNNMEILGFVSANDSNFLHEMKKINANLKINGIEIEKFLEFSTKKTRNSEKNQKKFQEFSLEISPDQRILSKNPYNSLTFTIDFYRIDKKVHKLISLIEIANIFFQKGKIMSSDEEIGKMMKNVKKNYEELYNFQRICVSSEGDLYCLEDLYQRLKCGDL